MLTNAAQSQTVQLNNNAIILQKQIYLQNSRKGGQKSAGWEAYRTSVVQEPFTKPLDSLIRIHCPKRNFKR